MRSSKQTKQSKTRHRVNLNLESDGIRAGRTVVLQTQLICYEPELLVDMKLFMTLIIINNNNFISRG